MTTRTPLQSQMRQAFEHLCAAGTVMQDAREALSHGSTEERAIRHALTLIARVRSEVHSLMNQEDKP